MEQQQGQSKLRDVMPEVTAFVDMCRAAYGADLVDRQLATAVKAQREHAIVLAEQGTAAAARWHRANAHRCTFVATEAGCTVGLALPTRATPPIGTPPTQTRPGNSAPARAPVAGWGESERVGEQTGRSRDSGVRSPAAAGLLGGVLHG